MTGSYGTSGILYANANALGTAIGSPSTGVGTTGLPAGYTLGLTTTSSLSGIKGTFGLTVSHMCYVIKY